jgi:hypothetical protein
MKRLGTKRVALTVQLIVAIFALIASSQNWVTFTLSDETALSTRFLDVSGNTIAPLTFALLLAALAGLAALTISNRGLSYVVLVAVAACGVGSSIVCANVANNPIEFAQTQLTKATGLAGTGTLKSYVVSTALSPWLIITAIASVALSILAIFAIANAHNWARRRTRYDSRSRRTADASLPGDESTRRVSVEDLADDRIDDWDALSSGEDPSATQPDSGATNPSRFD